MVKEKKTYLEDVARRVRLGILDGVFHAKSGHPGGSLSIADILTYLYFEEMRIDPERPKWEDRDRFVLSKGHAAPALYATLAARGYFPWEELSTLRQITSRLQGHRYEGDARRRYVDGVTGARHFRCLWHGVDREVPEERFPRLYRHR